MFKLFKKRGVVAGVVVAALAAIILMAWPKGASAVDNWIDGQRLKGQSVTSNKIAEGGVAGSEVRNGSLTGSDVRDETEENWRTQAAAKAKGDYQPQLDNLDSRLEVEEAEGDTVGLNESRAGAGYTKFAAPGYSVQWAKCSAGKVAISGGYRLNGHASEAFSGADQNAMPEGLTVVATEPAAEKGGVLVNSYQDPDFPQTEGGSFQANAWAVTFKNDTENPLPVRVWATCVHAN